MMASFIKGPNYVRSIRPSPWIDSILLRRLFFFLFSGCNCLFGGFFLFLLCFFGRMFRCFFKWECGMQSVVGKHRIDNYTKIQHSNMNAQFYLSQRSCIYLQRDGRDGMGWVRVCNYLNSTWLIVSQTHTWPSAHGSCQPIWVSTIQHAALEIEHWTYQYHVFLPTELLNHL